MDTSGQNFTKTRPNCHFPPKLQEIINLLSKFEEIGIHLVIYGWKYITSLFFFAVLFCILANL